MMTDISINPEFEKLIPPLSPEEFQGLEQDILQNGIRTPIDVWGRFIVDGHNRYKIAKKHGLPFKTEPIEFDSKEEAEVWMIRNQFNRRNISLFVRGELALELEKRLKPKAEKNKVLSGKNYGKGAKVSMNSQKPISPIDTIKEVSKAAGLGYQTVSRIKKIKAKSTPETLEKVRKQEISINKAYQQIKKQERKADIDKQRREIEQQLFKLPDGKFDVLVIDPPWNYGRDYDPEGSRVANPYPEMSQEELLKMDIPAAKDCVLWLWTTHQFIWDAKELLNEWGFSYKATLVWDKEKIGMGRWVRMQCEFCLLAVKGSPIWDNTQYRDIIRESRREHSRKPDAFYQMVDAICYGRKLDYFSREKRDGWESFGNDVLKFENGVAG